MPIMSCIGIHKPHPIIIKASLIISFSIDTRANSLGARMLSPNYFTGAVTSDRNWLSPVPLLVKHPSSPIYDIIPLKNRQ